MYRHAPRTRLATHEVTNQPPDFAPATLFDESLRTTVNREGGGWAEQRLAVFGARLASDEVQLWGEQANRHPPEFTPFDRYGRRIDEVAFHPAYHALMALAMEHGMHSIAWSEARPGGHVAHAALLAMMCEVEAGVTCPMSMTYASVPALRHDPAIADAWVPRILAGRYDAPLRPIAGKAGVTIGMAMTEKQGGSDVRANTTRAESDGADAWRLTGHKWFCSAPMSDAFLTLAYAPGGLSCFLVPRITSDGERNAIQLQRLKDKLGNRSNASSEIEYYGAHAQLLGEEGRGVATIIDMVHHTRLDTVAGTLGTMRAAFARAHHHVAHRRAFQRTLIDQPAMRAVIADLSLELAAATALTFRVARAFDESTSDPDARTFARLAVALAKFRLNKRAVEFVYECMECLGGAGYVEESGLPRLYREAPLNSIWEGSGNVIALDILRTLAKQPRAFEVLFAEFNLARGASAALDREIAVLSDHLATPEARDEANARALAERLAVALQASLLARHASAAVADAFVATRLGGVRSAYGTIAGHTGAEAIMSLVPPPTS
jgi:putative acyl-CoA dehydrogenase